MTNETDAMGAVAVSGLGTGSRHPVTPGEPCRNCGAIVERRYCSVCGQLGANFHRPVWTLLGESLSDMFTVDGRLWRSIPLVIFRPGRMTRNYLDGQRARYMPPFRIFLLSSVIFFLLLFSISDQQGWFDEVKFDADVGAQMAKQEEINRAEWATKLETLKASLANDDLDPAARAKTEEQIEDLEALLDTPPLVDETGHIDPESLRSVVSAASTEEADPGTEQIIGGVQKAAEIYENPALFIAQVKKWTPRLSLLFLPIFTAILTLLYAWHRNKYIYDHLISGLHVQAFLFLAASLGLILGALIPSLGPILASLAIPLIWLYLYRHLRVAYDSGRIAATLRASVLVAASLTVLFILIICMVVVSFALT